MFRLFQPTLFAAILIAGPAAASSILVLEAEDKTTPSIEVIEAGEANTAESRRPEMESDSVTAAGKVTDSGTTSSVPEPQERGSDPDVIRAGEKGKPIRRVGPAPSPSADVPTSAPAPPRGPVSRVE